MEDIKRRLELNSTIIKQQTVKKIYDQVIRIKDAEINEITSQTPELKFLWEKCGDIDVIVSTSCCQALLELLRCGKAQFDYILKGILNAVPNAKNLTGIVKTVTDILVLQLLLIQDKTGAYDNPYSIRNPPHPFITILTSRSDSWILLNQQVHHILRWPNSIVQSFAVDLLSPFLKFVLLEPAMSVQFTQLRLSLPTTCLQAAAGNSTSDVTDLEEKVAHYLLDLLPCLQVKTSGGQGEAIQYIAVLSSFMTTSKLTETQTKNYNQNKLLKILVNHILALTSNCINEGLDIGLLIDILMHILRKNQQVFSADGVLPELVNLLMRTSSHYLGSLLQLVDIYIGSTSIQKKPGHLLRGLLYLPLLNILTSVDPLYAGDNKYNQKLAARLLASISTLSNGSPKSENNAAMQFNANIVENWYSSEFVANVCQDLSRGPPSRLKQWLSGLVTSLGRSGKNEVSVLSVSLVVSLFCTQDDSSVIEMCLKSFETMSKIEPCHSISLLPVLLYKMNQVTCPHLKLQILDTLPKIATHKVSMAPILKSLQLLGGSPQLKALSIRLITALWKQQDRCFPYMQQLLIEKDFGSGLSETGINEVVLAKAASIRDICELRPHQHGEDMVQPLSAILNECTREEDAPSVSLALKGLYYLCEAEVIDIRTAWTVLAAKLSKDTRTLVVKGICELFSLVPMLAVGDHSYDKFTSDVLNLLWNYAISEPSTDPLIVNAAFEALAKFPTESFSITHLPTKITKDIIEAALAEMPEEFEVDESSLPAITGECYTKLLMSLPIEVQSGYEVFLTSLIHNEIANMPRGVHHSASRRQTAATTQNKAIASIPQFALTEYEKNKQPGLRPGLAAGLLFSYDPPMQLGRDGKPRKNHIAQYGKQYHQMLYTLINEVPIQPSEWHRSLVTPQAWTAFMDRCYIAYLEGRKCELQLELIQGNAQSQEENQLQQDTAWLWARDKLTDLIKSCSRGSPTAQGNSVCALVGLAVTSCKYVASLDQELVKLAIEEATEYTTQTHWVNMVTNTVLAILDFNYQLTGRIFSMCQQRTEKNRTPASLLARSGAAVAISQLIPCLISINADLIYQILALLSSRLPGATDSDDAGVIHFHCGLGTGSVLAALFEERFLDVAGMKGIQTIYNVVDLLEQSALSETDTRMGSVLGLGICLSAMCKDGKPETKVIVCRVHDQLTNVMNTLDKENTIYEAVCVSLSSITASAYAANILSQEVVDRTVASIYTSHIENPHLIGSSVALGMVCSGLLLAEHPTVKDLHEKLFCTWMTEIQHEDILLVNKIATIHGITVIAGANSCIMQIPCSSASTSLATADLVKTVTGAFHKSGDIGLKSCCPWLLGQFYHSTFGLSDSKSTVPSTYHYLPDTSTLKACVDVLIQGGKVGPTGISEEVVECILVGLNEGPNQALPPVNWPSILSPLIRMNFGEDVERLCLLLAVKQSPSSPSAAMFISTWILSPLYDSLSESTKLMLFDSLPTLIKVVAPAKLEEYLHHAVLGIFTMEKDTINLVWCQRAIWGLLKALQVNDPPQSITMLLYDVLDQLYHSKAVNDHRSVLHSVCKCLQEIPDNQVDKITEGDFNDKSRLLVGIFTRCNLVGLGSQPLTFLNQAIEALMHEDESSQQEGLSLLVKCFMSTENCNTEVCNLSSKTQWLLELMGHSKNLACERIDLEMKEGKLPLVIKFLLQIFSSAVLCWSGTKNKYLLGIAIIAAEIDKSKTDRYSEKIVFSEIGLQLKTIGNLVTGILPYCVNNLVSVEPWKQLTSKVIDWLIGMIETTVLKNNTESQGVLKGCLYSLRHSKDFNKVNTWSQVFCVSSSITQH